MIQGDLFAPPPKAPERRCGICVCRNALETDEVGDCAPHGARHKDGAPCDHWFGLDELRKPLYGASLARKRQKTSA